MTQSLLCSHRPLLSVSPVLGLSIPAPIFFLGTIFVVPIGGLGYDSNHLSPAATGAKFCLRDKVAIQQALDRTGMHDSAVNPLDHCHDTNFEITGVLLLLPVLCDYGFDQGLWLAIFHSSWNNAGFSLFKDNLIGYQSSILLNLVLLD